MFDDFCQITFHASFLIRRKFDAFSFSVGLHVLVDLGSNSVHVGGTFLGKSFTNDEVLSIFVLVGDLSNEGSSLELDEDVSDGFTSSESAVLGAGSVSLLGTVVLSEGVDSNLSSHVELVGDGGSSDVKPVGIVWSEVLETGCFIVDGPLYY